MTLQVKIAFNSSSYYEKLESCIAGPWYTGLAGYLSEKQEMKLDLKNWQKQLLELITGEYQNLFGIWQQMRKHLIWELKNCPLIGLIE